MTVSAAGLRIAHLIETEAALLRSFVSLLGREEALLIAGETDALVSLAAEKTELYQQLQRHHDARALILGHERMDNSDGSIRTLCKTMPDTLKRWDEIIALAREAQTRNATNGKLISERMRHNQAALSVLMAAADHPPLYDAGGVTRSTGRSRHLGSA
jgi:flagella synthesis protein FlgN